MCSPNMVFLLISPLTEAWSLYQTSSVLQALLLTCSFTSLQATILQVMNKLNAQFRLSSNIFMYIVTTNKITGLNFYLLQSLPIIMLQVLLPVFLYSLPIRDIIQTLLFIQNAILFPSEPMTLLQILMSYKVSSKLKSPWPNSIIKNPLMCNVYLLLISKQVTKSLSRLSSSESLGLQKNFLENILNPMKSSPSLVLYHLPSVFQSPYTLFIQFFMCSYLNLPCSILFLKEHNWPLLQL